MSEMFFTPESSYLFRDSANLGLAFGSSRGRSLVFCPTSQRTDLVTALSPHTSPGLLLVAYGGTLYHAHFYYHDLLY